MQAKREEVKIVKELARLKAEGQPQQCPQLEAAAAAAKKVPLNSVHCCC